MHSQVESRAISMVMEADETTLCTIGAMTQRLEHELEMVVSGTIAMSAQNTRTTIDHLCCALFLGVVNWHNCGTVLGVLEYGGRLVWKLGTHFVHYTW